MYGNDINTMKSLEIVNYAPSIESSKTMTMRVSYGNAYFFQRADNVTGGEFRFSTLKGVTEHWFDIKHDDIDFHDKTVSNCPQITALESSVSTLESQMTTVLPPTTAKCRIYVSGDSYAMAGQSGFRTFPGSGNYVDKISAGVVSVLLDVDYSTALDANFVATMNGYKDTPLVEAEQMIFCMNSPSAFYSSGVLIGYSFRIYGSRSFDQYNAFTDLGSDGRIYVAVNF
jgi:hypothetical protein